MKEEESGTAPSVGDNDDTARWLSMLGIGPQTNLIVTLPGICETFEIGPKPLQPTNEDLNASADEPERRWNIHLISYDTLMAQATPNGQRHLTKCAWSFAIFDESHLYKERNFMDGTIWLFSGPPIRPEDKTLMELHGADALQVAVRSWTQGIRSDDNEAQKAAAKQIIRIAKPWTLRRWSESKLANGEPLVKMPKAKEHIVNLTWTTAEQQNLQQHVNRYMSQGEGGVYWVHRWRLGWFSLVLGNTEDKNVRGEWIQSWSEIDDLSEPLLFRWL
ncbi:hypothetical protein BDD12DRAFT_890450 [Trichophaea hybrida]|nr:hypothetical protein BDD12DRAFT_890450 [Trichophaea hybrida]